MMTKNITLSANESLIQQARRRAQSENTTLNHLFRGWLTRYVAQPTALDEYDSLMARLNHIESQGPYEREEMNERH